MDNLPLGNHGYLTIFSIQIDQHWYLPMFGGSYVLRINFAFVLIFFQGINSNLISKFYFIFKNGMQFHF
jgi:hypothetical protein